MSFKTKYFKTYAAAVEGALILQAEGFSTAVLISGEVRYW